VRNWDTCTSICCKVKISFLSPTTEFEIVLIIFFFARLFCSILLCVFFVCEKNSFLCLETPARTLSQVCTLFYYFISTLQQPSLPTPSPFPIMATTMQQRRPSFNMHADLYHVGLIKQRIGSKYYKPCQRRTQYYWAISTDSYCLVRHRAMSL